jgi:hypothetical protein
MSDARTVPASEFYAGFRKLIPIAYEPRPLLSTPWAEKNSSYKYDLGVVRHYMGSASADHMEFARVSNMVNEGFASGRLWGLRQDIEGYLKEKGSQTSRPAMQFPMFTPMMSRMLGLLSQVEVYGRAESIDPNAEARKEKYMNQVLAYSLAAQVGPMMEQAYAEMGITGNPARDAIMADRSFQDHVVDAINTFVTVLSKRLKVDELKYEVGQSLTNGGIAAIHGYFYGDYPAVEPLSMEELITDPKARRRDLSDSSYIGFRKVRDLSDLMDIHHGKLEILKQLERSQEASREGGSDGFWPWGSPVEHTLYFRDGQYITRGFIETSDGLDLVDINAVNEDTGEPLYTEEDIIDPPDNKYTRGWKGKTDTKFITKLRYCSFIPREYNPSGITLDDGNKLGDVVLSHGECDWGEVTSDQEEGVNFPVFRCSWMNINGLIVAPLTAAQTPQRVMNIVTSDIVHRLSKAGGRSPVFDKRALAGQSVYKVGIQLKEGDPIEIDSLHAGSVSNALGYAGEGLDKNIFLEFDMIDKLKQVNESLTHLYDQNFGGSGSANELVGVKRLQWQQTSLAQHPYIEALRITFSQTYQWMANTVRRKMLRTPWALERIVGEQKMKVFEALGDMQTEEVKVEVKLGPDAAAIRQAVNETVMGEWLPTQLVDTATAAEIYGSSTFEQAIELMKRFNADRAEAMAQQAEAEAAAAPIQAAQQRDLELGAQENAMYDKMMEMGLEADKVNAKSEMPFRSAIAEHAKPQPEMATG